MNKQILFVFQAQVEEEEVIVHKEDVVIISSGM